MPINAARRGTARIGLKTSRWRTIMADANSNAGPRSSAEPSGGSGQSFALNRRDLLRGAGLAAGGLAAGGPAAGGRRPWGGAARPSRRPRAGEFAGGYEGGEGSMMYMAGHSHLDSRTEPPGAPP